MDKEKRASGVVFFTLGNASVLLMSDWLIQKCNNLSSLDLAQRVYETCGDVDGVRVVSTIREARTSRGKPVIVTVWNDYNTEEPPPNKRARTESSPIEDGETTTKGRIEEPGLSDVARIDAVIAGQDGEIARHGSPQADTTDVTKAADSLPTTLEGSYEEVSIRLPFREKCTLCDAVIPFKELGRGACVSGHVWKRCLVLFTVCADFSYKRCLHCGGCVSLHSYKSSPWLRQCLDPVVCCPECCNWLV